MKIKVVTEKGSLKQQVVDFIKTFIGIVMVLVGLKNDNMLMYFALASIGFIIISLNIKVD